MTFNPKLDISRVQVADGRRKVDHRKVPRLADSISEVGLLSPIVVQPAEDNPDFVLVAGAHRLEACKSLGWKQIPAFVVSYDQLLCQLAEIDENLCRLELTDLERDVQSAKRKEVYEALHPETTKAARQTDAGKNAGRGRAKGSAKSAVANPTFVADTASKTGRSERSIQEDVQIGSNLAPEEVERLAGTPAENNQRALKAIATEKDAEKRAEKLEAATAPRPHGKGNRKPKPDKAAPKSEPKVPDLVDLQHMVMQLSVADRRRHCEWCAAMLKEVS